MILWNQVVMERSLSAELEDDARFLSVEPAECKMPSLDAGTSGALVADVDLERWLNTLNSLPAAHGLKVYMK